MPAAISPRVPLLARVCGRTLLLAFLVLLITAALPIEPRSLAWATQLSSRIVDTASFPLLGVALLRLSTLLQPEPDPRTERREALALARRKDWALLLCRSGVISLGLLAVWQIPLLFGTINTLDQQEQARSGQLNQRLSQGEQTIRQASPAEIQREWQRLSAASAPGISTAIRDPEQQRQLLLGQLERQQKQLVQRIGGQQGQGRFVVMRNSLRVIALCAIYIAAFYAMGSRSV